MWWIHSRIGLMLICCAVWSISNSRANAETIAERGAIEAPRADAYRVGNEAEPHAQWSSIEWNDHSTAPEPDGARRRILATLRAELAAAAAASVSSSASRASPAHPSSTTLRATMRRDAATDGDSSSTDGSPVAASCTFYAPSIDSVRLGDSSLVVTIVPPENLAPSCQPVVSYSLRALAEGFVKVMGSSALDDSGACVISMTGLTNGRSYNLSARASDGQAFSQISTVVQATPAILPGAPSITSSKAGDQSIVLSFDAPLSDGGAPIQAYEVYDVLGSGASTSGPSSPLLLTGLINGQNYRLVVTASNARGTGPPSALSEVLMPQPVPTRPFVFAAQSGLSRKMLLYFFDPVGTGTVGTADYFRATARSSDMIVTAQSSQLQADSVSPPQQSPMELLGLTDGEWYNVSVSGINEAGEGLASWPVAVQVGATAASYSYFFANRSYQGGLCLPGAAAQSVQVPPISWDAMAQVNLGSLVNCSTLVAVITPPSSSSGSSGGSGSSSSTGSSFSGSSSGSDSAASIAPPPMSTGADGSTMQHHSSSSSSSSSGSSSSSSSGPDASSSPPTAASSTGESLPPFADDSTGAIASVPSDARPRSGAVRLEIHMLFNSTSVMTARAAFWRDIVARWAGMFRMDEARLVVVAVQPVVVNRAQKAATLRSRSATARRQQQQQQQQRSRDDAVSAAPQPHRSLASKTDVTLVVDVLPPLRTDDSMSSAGFAGNLTSALQDPESSVALSLASSGALVTQISSVEGQLPPVASLGDDGSSGLDTHSKLFIVGLSVGLACVAAMAVALGFMMWRGKQQLQRPVAGGPKTPPPVINDGRAKPKTNAAAAAAAMANSSKRPLSPYSVPVRGYDDRRGGQLRLASLHLEPAAAAAAPPAQAPQDRAKSSSPFNRALGLTHAHYLQPQTVPSGAATFPRRPLHRDRAEDYLEPYVTADHGDDDDDASGEKEEQYTLQREDEPHCTPQPLTRYLAGATAATTGGPVADPGAHYVFQRGPVAASCADSVAASSLAPESEPTMLMHDSVSAHSLQIQLQLRPPPRLAPATPAPAPAPAPLLHNFYEAAESEIDPLVLAAFKPQQLHPLQHPSASVSASASASASSSLTADEQSRCTPFIDQSPLKAMAAAAQSSTAATDSHSGGAASSESGSGSALMPHPPVQSQPQQSHGASSQPVSPLPPSALAAALPTPSTPPAQPQLGRSIMLLQPFSFAAAAVGAPRVP